MSFLSQGFSQDLVKALTEIGYEKLTPVQQKAIPQARRGADILALAQTGTGKTAAFSLPIIQKLIDKPKSKSRFNVRALILAPTRELAEQIANNINEYAKYTDINCAAIFGGKKMSTQEKRLEQGVDILVATPGRLIEHMELNNVSLANLEFLVFDEADRMLDMGFTNIVQTIAIEAQGRKQNMLFSATLEGNGVKRFAKELLNDPITVEAEPPRSESAKIHQWIHLADHKEHKFALLCNLLRQEDVKRAIVFVKTRDAVSSLDGMLQHEGIACAFMRGDMEQKRRFQALGRFTKGEVNVLLATDVAARGIDIDDITHVINYDMPHSADVYVHRIGRTGRAGAKGTAISLVEAHDMRILSKIERYIEQPLKRRAIEGLRPNNKEAKVPTKKKVKVSAATKKRKAKKRNK